MMTFLKRILLFTILFTITTPFYCQASNEPSGNYFFELTSTSGYTLSSRQSIRYLLNSSLKGFQIAFGTNNLAGKPWQLYNNFPRTAIGYGYSTLGNDKVFGQFHSLFLSYERSFFKPSGFFNISNTMQVGPAFVTKIFDLYNNRLNVALSTNWSFYLSYSINATFRLSPMLRLKFGGSFSHVSNGDYSEPNLGLNMFNFRSSIIVMSGNPQYIKPTKTEEFIYSRNRFTFIPAIGIKQYNCFNSRKFKVFSFSSEYTRLLTFGFGLGVGVDLYYDESTTEIFNTQKMLPPSFKEMIHASTHLSIEKHIGRFVVLVQPGIFIYKKFDDYGKMSNKIGLRYRFNNHLVLSTLLKSHWVAYADIIEWGIGYEL